MTADPREDAGLFAPGQHNKQVERGCLIYPGQPSFGMYR